MTGWPLRLTSAAVTTRKIPASTCLRSTAFSAAGSGSLKSTRTSCFLSSSRRRTTCVTSPALPTADANVTAAGWATRGADRAIPTPRRRRPSWRGIAVDSIRGLHPIEPQQLEQRHVLRAEEHRRLGSQVGVGVPRPRGHHEEVAGAPLEGLLVDRRRTLTPP